MQVIKSIIKRFTEKDKKMLGRWTIDYCDKKVNNKIDLSNEDHCGPCGQYLLQKTCKPVIVKKDIQIVKQN
jgi:hypothetical protein